MTESRYALEAPLEQGRFGTIYRAVDGQRAGTREAAVAVWVLPPEFVTHEPTLTAFMRDLEQVRALAHPNIARVLDVHHDGDTLLVVTELADAETLRNVLDALRPERLDVHEADAVVEAIGAALVYAHERRIVHGDVRAENVLVTGDHRIELGNFMLAGLARSTPLAPVMGDDTRALALLASELYSGVPLRPDTPREFRKRMPRRRLRAIDGALSDRSAGMSVGEFLANAGLAFEGARSRPRSTSRPSGVSTLLRRPIALAATMIAAVGIGFYTLDDVPRSASAVAALRDWIASGPGEHLRRVTGIETPPAPPADDNPAAATAVTQSSHAATLAGLAAPSAARTAVDVNPDSAGERPDGDIADEPEGARPRRALDVPSLGDTTPDRSSATAAIAAVSRVALSAASVTAYESQGIVTIAVVREGDLSRPVEVVWWTSDGTARARDDYASFGRRVESLEAGETVLRLYIPLAADGLAEDLEHFFVHIDPDAGNARIGGAATAKITIIDDDL